MGSEELHADFVKMPYMEIFSVSLLQFFLNHLSCESPLRCTNL